jgi:hypothetical protein
MRHKDERSTYDDASRGGASAVAVIWSIAYCFMLSGLLYYSMHNVISDTFAFLME